MILAAGEGQRLRPITETLPKALVKVGGRPLIEYAVETLVRSGITDIVVNLHHLGDLVRAHLDDGTRFGARIRYSTENSLQGTGGGIRQARSLLGDETFVTVNSDTIIDVDLGEVAAFHREHEATATLVVRKDPRMERFGLIRLADGGRVGAFLDTRRESADELEPFMYTGVQILAPRVFDYMPAEGAFSITEVTYPRMLRAGEPLYGYRFDGTWLTVGTPDELAEATARLQRTAR
jgi:NDP-sugar pyrophosphorylase family protein